MKIITNFKWLMYFICIASVSVISAQSVVVKGRNLMVNGSVYQIRGICYNPVPLGAGAGQVSYAQIDRDIQLMKDACINTVRTYSPNMGQTELDKLNNAGIKVIIGFWITDIQNGSYINYINQYKNHPAILMWGFGNEFNYHAGDMFGGNINNWYGLLNQAAGNSRNADPNHPAATIHGELPEQWVIDACPNVQVWGLNIYRGDNPGTLFSDFAARSEKPMFLGETGSDSYPDANAPVQAIPLIWNSVYSNITTSAGGICIGACFFEWTDEWWKSGNNNNQDTGGFVNGGAPYDGFSNEEYWGVLDVNHNPKPAYSALKKAFCKNIVINPSSTKGLVTVYKDCNHTGFSAGLEVGDYNLERLKALGVQDDDISSIGITQGFQAILYQDDNFTGASMIINSNNTCLNTNWNDKITSLRVISNGNVGLGNTTYYLQNRNSGLYMDVLGISNVDGANISQGTYNGGTNQQFKFLHLGDGAYQVQPVHSGKAVDINGISRDNGANVQQWTYFGTPNQQFIAVSTGDGYYKLIAKHSGKVVEVVNASTANGANVQQWENNNQTCGQWKLVPVTDTPQSSTLIQAESYSSMSGIQTEATTDTGGGFNVGWTDTNDWMAYNNINFPTSGSYLIEYRVASAISGARISTDLNGGSIQLGGLNVPNTGGWQNWQTISHNVNITAGTYNFGVFVQTGGVNINWIRITKSSTAKLVTLKTQTEILPAIILHPNPVDSTLFFSGDMTGISVRVFSLTGGLVISEQKAIQNSLDVSGLSSGVYFVVFDKEGKKTTKRFIKK